VLCGKLEEEISGYEFKTWGRWISMRRHILIVVALILIIVVIFSLLYFPSKHETLSLLKLSWSGRVEGEIVTLVVRKLNFGIESLPGYPPFERFSLVRGIEEIRSRWCEEPYLPTWLPEDIRYADVYIHSIAIIAFGDREMESFLYSKVTIQFVGPRLEPKERRENIEEYKRTVEGPGALGSIRKAIKVGDIWVDLAINAPVPAGPYERCHFALFWIEGNYYIVTVKPPLTPEDLLKIIRSMKPAKDVLR